MLKRLTLFALTLTLAGCSPANPIPTTLAPTMAPAVQETPAYAAPTYSDPAYAAPGVQAATEVQPGTAPDPGAYPSPAQDGAYSLFPPDAVDEGLGQGNFFVDSATLAPKAETPGMYDLFVEGSLPTPCNQPRAVVNPPDAQSKIVVTAYSVVEKDKMCTQVIQPFTGSMAVLGGYPSGTYTVILNDNPVGEISIP